MAFSNARVQREGIRNVHFVHGDAQSLDVVEGPFDAIVGRLILMYLPDAVAALVHAARRVRPGGVLCFQEGDMAYDWAYPMPPLWKRVQEWLLEALPRAHFTPRMGLALPGAFFAAGLPHPETRLEGVVVGDLDSAVWRWPDQLVELVPFFQRQGVVTASIGIRTRR